MSCSLPLRDGFGFAPCEELASPESEGLHWGNANTARMQMSIPSNLLYARLHPSELGWSGAKS